MNIYKKYFFVIIALLFPVISFSQDNKEIKESELIGFDALIDEMPELSYAKKYKPDVTKKLNELVKNNPSCKQRILVETAMLSEKSTPNNPKFFVQCGNKTNPYLHDVVHFTIDKKE